MGYPSVFSLMIRPVDNTPEASVTPPARARAGYQQGPGTGRNDMARVNLANGIDQLPALISVCSVAALAASLAASAAAIDAFIAFVSFMD
jgi:hypothetical protein